MKKKLSFAFIILLALSINASSLTHWKVLKQDPNQIYDIASVFSYPSTLINDEALNQEVLFDYSKNTLTATGIFQSEFGRFGFLIERGIDTVLTNHITEFIGSAQTPVEFGAIIGKKIKNVNIGFKISAFTLEDNYTDENSIVQSTSASYSRISLNPALSVFFTDKIILEASPEFMILNGQYSDHQAELATNRNLAYGVNARFVQAVSGNYFSLCAFYGSKPYSSEYNAGATSEEYRTINDSLKVGFVADIRSFNYINTIIGINYASSRYKYTTVYTNGSEENAGYSKNVFPEIAMGFNLYVNRHLDLNLGVNGRWITVINELYPALNPVTTATAFEWDYNLGMSLFYNDFTFELGFSKEISALPYIVTGNALNNLDISVGVSYSGFEY